MRVITILFLCSNLVLIHVLLRALAPLDSACGLAVEARLVLFSGGVESAAVSRACCEVQHDKLNMLRHLFGCIAKWFLRWVAVAGERVWGRVAGNGTRPHFERKERKAHTLQLGRLGRLLVPPVHT